jgi:hypothetical protein
MAVVETLSVVEEGIFTARSITKPRAEVIETSKRSEIGLRRFVTQLPRALDGRLSVALFPDGQFSLRLSGIGQWLCVIRFRDEMCCEYQAHTEHSKVGCWTKGAGTIEHMTLVISTFGVPVRLVED